MLTNYWLGRIFENIERNLFSKWSLGNSMAKMENHLDGTLVVSNSMCMYASTEGQRSILLVTRHMVLLSVNLVNRQLQNIFKKSFPTV